MAGSIEWARENETSVVTIFGCWLDETYLETVRLLASFTSQRSQNLCKRQGIDRLVKISKESGEVRFLFIEAPRNAVRAIASNIGYLRSKVCSQSNAKFVEIASPSDGIAFQNKLNSTLNVPIRLDEVPRTLIFVGGKLVGSVLGYRHEDLQRISRFIPGHGQYSRPSDPNNVKPRNDTFLQPETPQEAPVPLTVPTGTLLCADTTTKLLKKSSSKIADLTKQLQDSVPVSVPSKDSSRNIKAIKKNTQELADLFHSAVFDNRPGSSNEGHSRPRRLYEQGRFILERCQSAEQKLSRAKKVADFKASQLRYIGESVKAMEIMLETKSLEQWLVEECDYTSYAPLPSTISSPLAHLLSRECRLDSSLLSPDAYQAASPSRLFRGVGDTQHPRESARGTADVRAAQASCVGTAADRPATAGQGAAGAERRRRQERSKQVERVLERIRPGAGAAAAPADAEALAMRRA